MGDLARPLAQVRAGGLPYLGRRVGPLLLWDFDGRFCEPEGHRDPRTHCVPGLLSGKGSFFLPPHARFHTARFCPCPRFFLLLFFPFFVFFSAFEASEPHWIADAHEFPEITDSPSSPPQFIRISVGEGENVVRFLWGGVSWNPSVWRFF